MSIEEWARNAGFGEFHDVRGRNSIVDLTTKNDQIGIYLLHFANEEFYVGQSVHISQRFAEHRRRFDDIVGIAWKKASKRDLSRVEMELIREIEKAGFKTRNIALSAMPIGESDLDTIMSPEEQKAWLENDGEFGDFTERPDIEAVRRKNSRKFDDLILDENGNTNEWLRFDISILRLFIGTCIPLPGRTEFSFWSVSALPSNYKGFLTYFRVNMRNQEVFTSGYEKKSSVLLSHYSLKTRDNTISQE